MNSRKEQELVKRNAELKRQLAAKARESKIEAGLEKVRAVALKMKEPADMPDVCKVISLQLQSLGVKEIRNVQTAIFYETKGTYMNYEYYAKHKKTFITETVYTNHKVAKAFASQMLKGKGEVFITHIKGKKVKDWIAYQKTTNVFIDRYLEKAFSLNYYWHSLGPVALGISTYDPLSEEELHLFKRFLKVFELAYKRYMDIEQAVAQARESQIQLALERVRARTMAMHKSEELLDIIVVVSEQLQLLNIKFSNVSFGVNNPNYDLQLCMAVKGYPKAYPIQWSFLDNPGITRLKEAQQHPEKVFTDILTQDENNEWLQHIFNCNPPFDIFSDENKNSLLNTPGFARSMAIMKDIFLVMGNYAAIPYTEEENSILKRFANVFEQSYTRFLDLQKAEAQTREAQIEAALERVRARSMAMYTSQELKEVAHELRKQMGLLGLKDLDSCVIHLHEESPDFIQAWAAIRPPESMEEIRDFSTMVPKKGLLIIEEAMEAYTSRRQDYVLVNEGKKINQWLSFMKKVLPEAVAIIFESAQEEDKLDNLRSYWSFADFAGGSLVMVTLQSPDETSRVILRRFANVFGLAYRRFADLKQAEAQAREAQIEAALERVRSKTMAMHNSQDVADTVATMFDELVKLGIQTLRCGVGILHEGYQMELWTAKPNETGKIELFVGHLDMKLHPLLTGGYESWKDKRDSYSYELKDDDLIAYFNAINNYPGYQAKYDIASLPSRIFHDEFNFNEGCLFSFSLDQLSAESSQIFKRFAGVFGQTYRRYLDLQKAEAQAREAQIEAGLERVRARTMAMHSSEDVGAATATMFTELERLGIENFRGGITNIHPDRTQDVWSVNNLAEGKTVKAVGAFNMDDHPFWQLIYEEWVNKKDFVYTFLTGKAKEDYIKILNANQSYLPQAIQQFPDVHFQVYIFNEGGVWTNSLKPHTEEDKQVMKRFASVFSLTFRRYQDLKKAEQQAKEATIEAALEKVRGKAMAMHNSNDLSVTASMVFTELRKLGINPIRCGVGIINKETTKAQLYAATASADGDSLALVGWVMLEGHPVLEKIYETWLNNEEYYPELQGEQLRSYYKSLLSGLAVKAPDATDEQKQYGTFLPFSVGCLYAWSESPYNDAEIRILKRFATIIDLTFRRYIELQKSETNAREAVKQAALDRVRAEIASMRTVSDLEKITPLIWNELTILGVPFIRCGVFLMDDSQKLIHTFLSTPDGKAIAAFHLPYDTPGNFAEVVKHWRNKHKFIDHWGQPEFISMADTLVKQGAISKREQYLNTLPEGGFYLHFLPFLQGMLYVANTRQLGNEELTLIQSVADAFSTAYARYEDFNKLEAAKQQVEKTLADLKQTQQQLVQSEKMASLGEMTAGIAHEIQNPLNFVNNFSEVSKELLDEMKTELNIGNTADAKDIADDVIRNLEKINHHGKRADAIVKSMLQHSRSSSGKKEPTDINGLADEYLRLAYHGLRAKDKSFNAKFETEFDNSIGKINIISQDIGRVLVNLINNAFYAVSEKKKQEANGYEPTVTVLTKKTDDKIEIMVKDNGNGIPQKVLDKIFQPFFTTKPTGQGTGLGLSLSYDIITKGHGGELKVETKEKEGTIFIVQLPL